MTYDTYYDGAFEIVPPLAPEHRAYLKAFSDTRHQIRHVEAAAALDDPLRLAVGLPIGEHAEYFVGEDDRCVADTNNAPPSQPAVYCHWFPNEDGDLLLAPDGGVNYSDCDPDQWLKYLIERFLTPWGYTIDGTVEWSGDDPNDRGTIYAQGHQVLAVTDTITNVAPDWFDPSPPPA